MKGFMALGVYKDKYPDFQCLPSLQTIQKITRLAQGEVRVMNRNMYLLP
jgi:hypothetical protein